MDSNLPNNQHDDPVPQQNPQDDGGQTGQSYGLSFQPPGPVGNEATMVVENVETIQEIQKPEEKLRAPETEAPIPMPTAAQLQDDPTAVVVPVDTKKEDPKVVDKTETLTTLHHVVDTPDVLTKEADKDEEHFIEEVEKHHGHQ